MIAVDGGWSKTSKWPRNAWVAVAMGVIILALAVVGLLFVINVPVPKPRGMFYVILPLLAAGLIAHWVERYLQFSVSL